MTTTVPAPAYTEERIRQVLWNEAHLRLELKRARAESFLSSIGRGHRVAEAWQEVALATAELERTYEAARVEKLVLWALTSGKLPAEVGESGGGGDEA